MKICCRIPFSSKLLWTRYPNRWEIVPSSHLLNIWNLLFSQDPKTYSGQRYLRWKRVKKREKKSSVGGSDRTSERTFSNFVLELEEFMNPSESPTEIFCHIIHPLLPPFIVSAYHNGTTVKDEKMWDWATFQSHKLHFSLATTKTSSWIKKGVKCMTKFPHTSVQPWKCVYFFIRFWALVFFFNIDTGEWKVGRCR